MKSYLRIILLIISCHAMGVMAEILLYPFTDPVKEERFNNLIKELRCPKCQNNNLADSNSPLSVDLKDIIYEKINAGESDEAIIDFLKARYGDFISYRPPVNSTTWFIWFGPFVMLFSGLYLIYRFLRGRKERTVNTNALVNNSEVEKYKSDKLLKEWSKEIRGEEQ